MTPNNTLGAEFIAQLARGGFAETMTDSQRAAIHIETRLDEFLEEALDDGKQIVLTGNPGDGKTQYILMQERRRGAPGNAYYLPDASSESDYSTVLEEWKEALSDGRPGILAINEGPLYEMLTHHQDEYEFLDTVAQQLRTIGKIDVHVTIRDLLNFIAHCITGGKSEAVEDFDEDLKYYNLAYSGRGTLFDLFRQHVNPQELTHPFVDSSLWSRAEQEVAPRDTDDARDEIEKEFLQLKRRFLFEDEGMDLGYSSKILYHDVDYEFLQIRNEDSGTTEDLENLLRRINGYFSDSSGMTYELQLWFSHKYIGRSTKAILTRHSVSKSDFRIQRPKLNPSIEDAMEYIPNYAVLQYTAGENTVQLEVDRSLYESFSRIDSGIPYALRDREEEQVLLEFMRDIEYQETPGESTGTVTIKDAETGQTETIRIQDDRYNLQ